MTSISALAFSVGIRSSTITMETRSSFTRLSNPGESGRNEVQTHVRKSLEPSRDGSC